MNNTVSSTGANWLVLQVQLSHIDFGTNSDCGKFLKNWSHSFWLGGWTVSHFKIKSSKNFFKINIALSTEKKKLLWTFGHIATVGNARMTKNKTIKNLFCYNEHCEQRTEIFLLIKNDTVSSTWVNWWVFMSNWAQ